MISSSTSRKIPAAEPLLGGIAEEAFDHVKPRTARRSEVHKEPRVPGQPPLHLGVLVRGIVVCAQVQVLVARRDIVDHA